MRDEGDKKKYPLTLTLSHHAYGGERENKVK
jgi:hypothetical protein